MLLCFLFLILSPLKVRQIQARYPCKTFFYSKKEYIVIMAYITLISTPKFGFDILNCKYFNGKRLLHVQMVF